MKIALMCLLSISLAHESLREKAINQAINNADAEAVKKIIPDPSTIEKDKLQAYLVKAHAQNFQLWCQNNPVLGDPRAPDLTPETYATKTKSIEEIISYLESDN